MMGEAPPYIAKESHAHGKNIQRGILANSRKFGEKLPPSEEIHAETFRARIIARTAKATKTAMTSPRRTLRPASAASACCRVGGPCQGAVGDCQEMPVPGMPTVVLAPRFERFSIAPRRPIEVETPPLLILT
jgi:hypothetical protein